jgi:lincosamide nucleotidyltransferase A/C/D/E
MMRAEDVLEIVSCLEKASVTVWLDGGWAVDAILKKQTRIHQDLDLVVELNKVQIIRETLMPSGFSLKEDELPTRFVLSDAIGRQLDFHTVTFNAEGGGVQTLPAGRSYTYPASGFEGMGEINGQPVKCLTAEVQAECHYGYEPDENDRHDMRLLQQYCGICLKAPYV